MDSDKIKRNIQLLMDRATEKQLRLLYLFLYEIVKRP